MNSKKDDDSHVVPGLVIPAYSKSRPRGTPTKAPLLLPLVAVGGMLGRLGPRSASSHVLRAGEGRGDDGKQRGRAPARVGWLWQVLLAAVVLLALFSQLQRNGTLAAARAALEPAALRDMFRAAGPVGGVLLYALFFALGEILHLPGALFVSVGIIVWGRYLGWLLAILSAPLALSVPFLVMRRVGGAGMLGDVRLPLFKNILDRLDARPLSTVILLRCCFFMSPPATYALALSSVPFRTYFLGSFLGLILPLTVITVFSETAMRFLAIELPSSSTDDVVAIAAGVAGEAGGEGVRALIAALSGADRGALSRLAASALVSRHR